MKLPILPIAIAAGLLITVLYLFNSLSSNAPLNFGQPNLTRVADLEGIETEVAIAPDGERYLVVASGDLWLLNIRTDSRQQLTQTTDTERFPSWNPDGKKFSFGRGDAVYVMSTDDPGSAQVLKANASDLSWSFDGQMAFVRDRGLWLSDPAGVDRPLVQPDANPDITIRGPRFSPDSAQVAYIRSMLNFRGEVWIADTANGAARSLVADRPAENPLDVGWIENGRQIVYLTNRSGAYTLWVINLSENTIAPLTMTLNGMLLDRIGMSVWQDRIVVPRHFLDSDIVLSDGSIVAQTENVELEPAASPDGRLVAYTVENDNKYEIWTAAIDGTNPTFRGLGREPRFSTNGFQIAFTYTNLTGNQDVWKIDLRDGSAEGVTDAGEPDLQPEWSPTGRDIAFTSGRGGGFSVWTVSAAGGKRLRLNDAGCYPRYFPTGESILFWARAAFWTMDIDGGDLRTVREGVADPAPAIWTKDGPRFYQDPEINGGQQIWPHFDILPDGRILRAPIEVRETGLWAVDLRYVTE